MCLFRKKKVAVKTQDDKELIAVNSKSIEALIVLAKDNIDIVETLKELQEKIKYLTPSNNFKVIDYDKLIKNKIDDLRMVLIKFDSVVQSDVEKLIVAIKLAIADRNTKL
ncbi:MAG: hypothetical protein HFJ81_07040 [Clostridia bacterium]|nr:hypothetical protein [Clostridia bacterium]